jgi:hypothetical protein
MKPTIIAIVTTALVTSFCWYVGSGLRRGLDELWLIDAVKAPGQNALADIEADLQAGRPSLAHQKIAALSEQWTRFYIESGFRGLAIGNIMATFGQLNTATEAKKTPAPEGNSITP